MKRNPHIVKLEFLAIAGLVLGLILILLGAFNPALSVLLLLGVVVLAGGIVSWLLSITAAAIRHRD